MTNLGDILKEIKNNLKIVDNYEGISNSVNELLFSISVCNDSAKLAELYSLLGEFYLKNNKDNEAIKYFSLAIELVKCNNIHDEFNYYKLLLDITPTLARLFAKKNDYHNSLTLFQKYIYHRFKDPLILGYDVPCFSFRAINEYTLDDLENNQITVVSPKLFNDPFDPLLLPWISSIDKKVDYDIGSLKDACDGLKIKCFVSNKGLFNSKRRKYKYIPEYRNYLMWSHYANSHNGICIEYFFDSSFSLINSGKGIFSEWIEVKYISKVSFNSILDIKKAIGAKHNCWSYENEIRLVHYDPSNKDIFKAIKLPSQCYIKSIYFGVKCKSEDINYICNKLKGQDIRFYKMTINPSNVYIERAFNKYIKKYIVHTLQSFINKQNFEKENILINSIANLFRPLQGVVIFVDL